jgi:hypothetical protein
MADPEPAAAPAGDSSELPREPVIVFAPYLPLREPVEAGEWWIGPLAEFKGHWHGQGFEDLARKLIASFQDARGRTIENPALVAHRQRGADGTWAGVQGLRTLQVALDFAVLDENPNWDEDDESRQGWLTATSDNSRLIVWSIDLEGGRIALSDGAMVQTLVGGLRIDNTLVMRAPTELHIPKGVFVARDMLAALVSVIGGEKVAEDPTLAKRLAIAATWLAQTWRNTVSIRQVERIVMLKTAFEALTNESSWKAADRLDALFGGLRAAGVTDEVAHDLLWQPSETASMDWTWTEDGKSKTKLCTPLSHWFNSFARARNQVIHDGVTSETEYDGPATRYRGPHVFIGERLLREAIRVALRQFGYENLWQSHTVRLLAEGFAKVKLGNTDLQVESADTAKSLPPIPDALEARPIYLVERRRAGGWLAWTAREGVSGWQPVRFAGWADDRDNVIPGDASGLMQLSAMVLSDALGDDRSFDELYRDDSGQYQLAWHRFFEEVLLTISEGSQRLLSPRDVLAWASGQAAFNDLLEGGAQA